MPQGHRCVAIRDGLEIVLKGQKTSKIPKVLSTWGDHIKKRRLELGLLQREAAERLGVNEASVYNWERHRNKPQLWNIPKIIAFLEYEPELFQTQTLGQILRTYRQGRGLSRKKLARLLEIDPSTLQGWEQDRRRPSEKHMSKLADFLRDAPTFRR